MSGSDGPGHKKSRRKQLRHFSAAVRVTGGPRYVRRDRTAWPCGSRPGPRREYRDRTRRRAMCPGRVTTLAAIHRRSGRCPAVEKGRVCVRFRGPAVPGCRVAPRARCRDRTSLPVDGDRQDQMPQAAGAIACSGSWSLPVVANRPGVDQMIMRGLSQARLVAGVGRGAP
jgi:hypothetical protein